MTSKLSEHATRNLIRATSLSNCAIALMFVVCMVSCNWTISSDSDQSISAHVRNGGFCIGPWCAFSADGQSIICASPTGNTSERGSVCDLWRMNIDGSERTQLTFGANYDGQPAISPDGKTIAFVSERDGPSKIFLMNRDGTDVRRLSRGDLNDSRPVFSRDSSRVYFVRRVGSRRLDDAIFSIDADGNNEKRVTQSTLCNSPIQTTKDSASLYFMSLSGLDPKSGVTFDLMKQELRSGKVQKVNPLGLRGNLSCDVSVDDRLIAFVSDSEVPFEYEVYVGDLDGRSRSRLTQFRGYISTLSLSPDGKRVAFVREAKESRGSGKGDIYIATVDGKTLQKIGSN